MAVRTNLRILLAILWLVLLALALTGPLVFVRDGLPAAKAVVAALALVFPGLLWLLAQGHRRLVVWVFAVGVSILAILPQLVSPAMGGPVAAVDRIVVNIVVQLVLVATITEHLPILGVAWAIGAVGLHAEVFWAVWPPDPGARAELLGRYINALVNLSLVGATLAILQQAFHHAVRQVEANNRTLESRIHHRTLQVRRAQQALVAGERLAVAGRLAAGVAHEINSPLGAIQSSNSTIRVTLPEVLGRAVSLFRRLTAEKEEILIDVLDRSLGSEVPQGLPRRRRVQALTTLLQGWGVVEAPAVAEVLVDSGVEDCPPEWQPLFTSPEVAEVAEFLSDFTAVLRAGRIVDAATQKASRYILALQKSILDQSTDLSRESLEVDESLEAVLTLLEGQIAPEVRVFRTLEPGLVVEGKAAQLMQAWSSLVLNGLRAMGAQGTLTLVARRQGDQAEIVIGDSAETEFEGFREEGLEPFETEAHRRGGLGWVREVVEAHEGQLTCESRPGATRFIVRLPLAEAAVPLKTVTEKE